MKPILIKAAAAIFLVQSSFTVNAQCPVNQQTVNAASPTITCQGSSLVGIGTSEIGVNYYLLNSATGAVVSGPVPGNGMVSGLALSTGTITSTTIFEVYGANPSNAVQFNGSSQYATVAAPVGLPTGSVVTVEAWVYPTGYPDGTYNGVVSYGPRNCSPGGATFLLSMTSQGRPSMATWCNDVIPSSGPTATLNAWNHIACVIDGNKVSLFLNGFEWTYFLSFTPAIVPGVLNIGCTDNPGRYFQGRIDEVRIWNTARTKDELDQNRLNCLTGTEPGLVSYYKFEEGAGAVLNDLAGSNDANLINAPSWVTGSDVCSPCDVTMTQTATVTVIPPADQTVSPATQNVCPNTAGTITLGSSQTNITYTLYNSGGAVADGPLNGTGAALNFSTGNLLTNETFTIEASSATGGFDLDGIDDYVLIPGAINGAITNAVTIETWIKPDSWNTGEFEVLVGEAFMGDNVVKYSIYQNSGLIYAGFYSPGWSQVSFPAPPTGEWVHIASTYDQNEIRLYFNGLLVASAASTLPIPAGSEEWRIGKRWDNSEVIDGKMDQVAIWNTARTTVQIQSDMMNCLTGAEPGLVAYYNFEDGTGSGIALDLTANNNDGYMANTDAITCWSTGVPFCSTCSSVMTQTVAVNLQDNAATVASAPGDFTVNVDPGMCSAVVTYIHPTFNDDCDGASLAGIITDPATASGQTFTIGTSTVTFTYTDASLNVTSESFDITVVDDEAPAIMNCPADISTPASSAGCMASVTWTDPTASDNCTVPGMTSSHNSGDFFPEGITTVTYSFDDGNGNTATCSFDVEVINDISGSSVDTDVSCFGLSDGAIALTVTGGTAPFTFAWTDGGSFTASTEDLTGIPAETYTVTGTDANGCQGSGNITINEPAQIVITVDATASPSSCGLLDGSAMITASGGTESGAYDYDWTDGVLFSSALEDQPALGPGIYNVTVTDDISCTGVAVITISDLVAPTIILNGASSLSVTCNGDSDGFIQLDVTLNGGATTVLYDWDNDGTGDYDDAEDLSGLAPGTYNLQAVDNNNCTAPFSVTIANPTLVGGSVLVTPIDCNGNANGEINLTAVGGTESGSYDYDWTDGGSFSSSLEDLTNLAAGTYIATITDDNGCTGSASYTMIEPLPLSANGIPTDELFGGDGTINLTATGGIAPYTYSWTGPGGFTSTSEDLNSLIGGTYNVTVTDAHGCTTTEQVFVDGIAGVSEMEHFSFIVFPNPATGVFTVAVTGADVTAIRILDATGRVVMTISEPSATTQVDAGKMERGVYFVQVEDGNTIRNGSIVLQ